MYQLETYVDSFHDIVEAPSICIVGHNKCIAGLYHQWLHSQLHLPVSVVQHSQLLFSIVSILNT